jgi:UDP-N-acetylmuramate--alanine ligase
MKLDQVKNVFFIGIGGIGMSALARYFVYKGCKVTGYDKTETELTKTLVKQGIDVVYDEDVKWIPGKVDLVIYTPAIPADQKQLVFLQSSGIPMMKRSEVLGMLSQNHKTLGIAGTHGKTTTSGILAHILRNGGVDVSAFIGGILSEYNTNFFAGASEWMVIEADEYDRSFLRLHPYISVLNSMDPDHLDIYGNKEYMREGFFKYLDLTQAGGFIFIREGLLSNFSRDEISQLSTEREIYTFGEEEADVLISDIRVENGYFVFNLDFQDFKLSNIYSCLPGRHNIYNTAVAIAVALSVGVSSAAIVSSLKKFKGIKRRFEIVSRTPHLTYVDDYAHHPGEIEAVHDAVREMFPNQKLLAVFQPHLFSRTKDFAEGFAKSLDAFDEIVLLDIYPAREVPIAGVTSKSILNLMNNKNAELLAASDMLIKIRTFKQGVILTIGAGDIDKLVPHIREIVEK